MAVTSAHQWDPGGAELLCPEPACLPRLPYFPGWHHAFPAMMDSIPLKPQGQCVGVTLSFYHMGAWEHTQFMGLGSQHPRPLSHLANPTTAYWRKRPRLDV